MSPARTVYSSSTSSPSSSASRANTPLHELARAEEMSCSPWARGQVMAPSPTWVEPVQVQVRSKRSGMRSMAAESTTVLYTEPGGKVPERKRLRYTPS
ncbi:Uncharacterised protein [Flavonifractor plautii]|uniref:Uncharacterized protein n=1 Tax=Flavonifractor plautii TaxID=292800 RepID=A0A174JJ48_FLAPL|nr:Uncharacterised protein [Flavonifractor plautii]